MSKKIKFLNPKTSRSVENLLGVRSTFVTTGGIFTGTISAIDENYAYELQDVIFRPAGAFKVKMKIKICEIFGPHIIATFPDLEAPSEEL